MIDENLSIEDIVAYSDACEALCAEIVARKKPRHLIIDSLGHEQAVSEEEYVLKRREAVEAKGRPLLSDDPNSLSEFRSTFANWDFSEGTY